MIGKKKKEEPILDYTKWDTELGFLSLVIKHKLAIAEEYNIKIYATKLQEENEFVRDKDIDAVCEDTIREIDAMLAENYKKMLITKYFNTESSLLTFIAETVREEITKTTVGVNATKIKNKYSSRLSEEIVKLNNANNKKEN